SYKDNIVVRGMPVRIEENCTELTKKLPRLVCRGKRQQLIAACRRKRPTLLSANVGIKNRPVIISDHLSPYSKRLFCLANERKREHDWKYVWTRDCVIFA